MRISSQQVFSGGINRLQDLNSELQKTQQQISTGKRVNNPSDDPVAAARVLKLNQQSAGIKQFQRANDLATNRLQQEESALSSVTDVLQRVRELTVQAGNGSLSSEDRQSIAAELRERIEQLGSLANTRDASGEYVFSGFKGDTPAFAKNISGDYVYQGDEGQRSLEIDVGVKVPISDHGKGLFVDVPSNKPTFIAEASPNNQSTPPARISSGMVLDQEAFEKVYPDDLIIKVDDTNNTFTVTNRSTNDDLTPPVPDNAYSSGKSIKFAGVQVEISGADDDDKFILKTADKQSVFTTVEKLIYGLEQQKTTPSKATITTTTPGGFSPDDDDTLTINGVSFSGTTAPADLSSLTALRDAINGSTDAKLEKVSAEISGGDLVITAESGNLEFEADDGGTKTGVLIVQSTQFKDLNLAAGITTAATTGNQAFDNLVADSLTNLDNAQESILKTQTEIGGRLNTIDSTKEFLTDSSVFTDKVKSELQDVDYAEAISNLSFQSFVLQAAQQSFAQISRLSLFDSL